MQGWREGKGKEEGETMKGRTGWQGRQRRDRKEGEREGEKGG